MLIKKKTAIDPASEVTMGSTIEAAERVFIYPAMSHLIIKVNMKLIN